jgi:hypothetical protein
MTTDEWKTVLENPLPCRVLIDSAYQVFALPFAIVLEKTL